MTCDYLRTYIRACVFNKDNGWHTDYRFVCTISMNMANCIVHMKLAFNQQNAVCVVLWAGMESPLLVSCFLLAWSQIDSPHSHSSTNTEPQVDIRLTQNMNTCTFAEPVGLVDTTSNRRETLTPPPDAHHCQIWKCFHHISPS